MTAGLGSVFPAGAYQVRSGSNGTDEPWWLAAPALLEQVEQRDYAAIRTFARADLGRLEWDTSIVHEAHAPR